MTKESIHQGSIIILNIYVYHRRASKHIKQKINRNYKHRHISTLCVYICCIYVIYIYILVYIYTRLQTYLYICTHNSTVGDFNSFLLITKGINTEISNDIEDLNNTMCYHLILTFIATLSQQEQNINIQVNIKHLTRRMIF